MVTGRPQSATRVADQRDCLYDRNSRQLTRPSASAPCMPKSLREFSSADWRHLRPLTQSAKSLRYRLVDRAYRARRADSQATQLAAAAMHGRNVLVTIAFDDPQLVEWQIRLVRRYVPHAVHVVLDNSSSNSAAADNRRIADEARVRYVRAPSNPWSAIGASRSHGIVLNWCWHNMIRLGEPAAFGFLDHDIFPTAADDPFAPLATQDVYGIVRPAGPRWFLWAGFCMFRFAAVRNKPLDFGQDWFNGLDTGGGNWKPLYRHIDLAKLARQPTSFVPFRPGITVAAGPLQWCGTWLHEVGQTGDPRFAAEKRARVAALLAPHLDAAAGAL
jgi:hypothetical protein